MPFWSGNDLFISSNIFISSPDIIVFTVVVRRRLNLGTVPTRWPFSKTWTSQLICEMFEANERPYYGRDLIRLWSHFVDRKGSNMGLVKNRGRLFVNYLEKNITNKF